MNIAEGSPRGSFIDANAEGTSSFEDFLSLSKHLVTREWMHKRLNEICFSKDMIITDSFVFKMKRGGSFVRE